LQLCEADANEFSDFSAYDLGTDNPDDDIRAKPSRL
jgi:hypothetical protein